MKKILETLKLRWAEYLLEIIVIVIGILVAFGLNEWNDIKRAETVANKERKEIITALYNDLQVDIKNLDVMIKNFTSNYEGAIILMELIETKATTKLDSSELFLLVDHLVKGARVNRKQNTFDGLVSFGKLKTLENDSLTSLLLDYYADYDHTIKSFDIGPTVKLTTLFIESFNSEDLIKIGNLPSSSHTKIRLQDWFENRDFSKMIASTGAQSGAFSHFFFRVKSKAQSISEYIDENYSDILHDLE